jgi:hypothetical protein
MSKTRLARIEGFGQILVGKDISDIFEEGHVYAFRKILGQIVVDDLGKHAYADGYDYKASLSDFIESGHHNMTQEEFNKSQKLAWENRKSNN